MASPLNSLDKHTKGATNEHLRKIYNTINNSQDHMKKRRGLVKKHNCLNLEAKSEASLCLPSRPSTRRNHNATPKEPGTIRSCSMGPIPLSKSEKMFKFKQKRRPSVASTRSNNSDVTSTSLRIDLQVLPSENGTTPASTNRSQLPGSGVTDNESSIPQEQNKTLFSASSEDHEYLLFLLRITEDIISNDFCSNEDIKKIFTTHVELNKSRLQVRKMNHHITNLCTELNIDCNEYQTPDASDKPDSPRKYQNYPGCHRYALNNEAFKNCPDCSVIRTSSLYKMPIEDCDKCIEKNGENSSFSPSLLKLLDKLSLGTVTECTEPAASTSTINSPRIVPNYPKTGETNVSEHTIESPLDFETFVKKLNSKEDISNTNKNDRDLSSESPPLELDRTALKENLKTNTDLQVNAVKHITCKSPLKDPADVSETPIESRKSYTELSEKELYSYSASEKYDSEFEKCSSNISIAENELGRNEEDATKNDKEKSDINILEPKLDSHLNDTPMSEDKISKSSKIPVYIKDSKTTTEKVPELYLTEENIDRKISSDPPKSAVLCRVSTEPSNSERSVVSLTNFAKYKKSSDTRLDNSPCQSPNKELKLNTISKEMEVTRKSEINNVEEAPNNRLKNQFNNNNESDDNLTKQRKMYKKHNFIKVNEKATNQSNLDSPKNHLKLFLEGTINDEDFVMIKGPVYVYKPLLESEPKLVVLTEDNPSTKSRRNSLDSQHSNRTFTVDHDHVFEYFNVEASNQHDHSLHSLEPKMSMENILNLAKTSYSQFTDLKLLQSDYDLTPEKDGSDNKYHNLLVDATSSVSGVNITENLLLNDEYLVNNNDLIIGPFDSRDTLDEHKVSSMYKNTRCSIDSYRKFEPKMYENNYVIHRKLEASISMPKLKLNSSRLASDRSLPATKENVKSGALLGQCSSEFISLDIGSQDSSLRSEGEAIQYADSTTNGFLWNRHSSSK